MNVVNKKRKLFSLKIGIVLIILLVCANMALALGIAPETRTIEFEENSIVDQVYIIVNTFDYEVEVDMERENPYSLVEYDESEFPLKLAANERKTMSYSVNLGTDAPIYGEIASIKISEYQNSGNINAKVVLKSHIVLEVSEGSFSDLAVIDEAISYEDEDTGKIEEESFLEEVVDLDSESGETDDGMLESDSHENEEEGLHEVVVSSLNFSKLMIILIILSIFIASYKIFHINRVD